MTYEMLKISEAPAELQKSIMLLNGIKILDIPLTELKVTCKTLIGNCYLKTGFHSPGESAIKFMIENFALDLKNYFSQMTIEEVAEALRKGIYKEYGDYLTISNTTLFSWIKAFKMSPERFKAINHISTPPEKEMTADERKSISEQSVAECKLFYEKTGFIFDYGNGNYNYLWKEGKLRFSEIQWMEFVKEAKERLEAQLEDEKTKINSIAERRLIKKQLNGSEEIKIEARKLALKYYFDNK